MNVQLFATEKSLQDADIHYCLTQSDSLAELKSNRKSNRKSKPVMESVTECGHFGVVILQ